MIDPVEHLNKVYHNICLCHLSYLTCHCNILAKATRTALKQLFDWAHHGQHIMSFGSSWVWLLTVFPYSQWMYRIMSSVLGHVSQPYFHMRYCQEKALFWQLQHSIIIYEHTYLLFSDRKLLFNNYKKCLIMSGISLVQEQKKPTKKHRWRLKQRYMGLSLMCPKESVFFFLFFLISFFPPMPELCHSQQHFN